MAKKIILTKKSSNLSVGKMEVVGVFTQKKILWETINDLDPNIESHTLYNDVADKSVDTTYSWLCKLLTKSGRAHIIEKDTRKPLFFMVECEENTVRDSDFDEDGSPVYNPVVKKDEG